MTQALLVVDNVSHNFRSASGETLALRDVSMQVWKGEFVALVGPSGCGKTTLLRMFAGLLHPEAGRIIYRREPLTGPPTDVGMVFQKPSLLPWRTVTGNIQLPLTVAGRGADKEGISAMLEAVGLAGFADALPAELSGGMQQRVALARALITDPRLLLMDEPFAALDMLLRSEMNQLLLDLWQQTEPTVIFVTHDIHEAVFLADRVITMSPRPGRIVGNFPIALPRPRNQLDRYGREVQGYVEQVWHTFDASR